MRNGKHAVAVFALLGALGGCDAALPAEPVVANATGIEVSASPRGAVVASANGAAHREAAGGPVLLNFNARLYADGSAAGSYFYHAVAVDQWLHVDVTCMSLVGDDQAFVAGIIRDAFLPALVGTVSYFYTKDNGEGANALPDEVSLVRANDVPEAAQEFCTEQPTLLPNREVLHGNVQVRN